MRLENSTHKGHTEGNNKREISIPNNLDRIGNWSDDEKTKITKNLQMIGSCGEPWTPFVNGYSIPK